MIDQILVDDVLVEFKIIEEWGFNLGEDACLFEEEEKFVLSCPDNAELHDDIETNNNVDILVDKIVKDLKEAEDNDLNINNNDRHELVNLETMGPVEEHASQVPQLGCLDSPQSASQAEVSLSNDADSLRSNGGYESLEKYESYEILETKIPHTTTSERERESNKISGDGYSWFL